MAMVFNFVQTITCGGDPIVLTPDQNYSYWRSATPKNSEFTIDTFEQLKEYVEKGEICSAYLSKKAVFMDYGFIKFTARNFKPIKVEERYKPVYKAPLLDLLHFLPADEMADWLKDHGLMGIPSEALTNN